MCVSIHAFRGEGDFNTQSYTYDKTGFNPRLPGGRRHTGMVMDIGREVFQSTPSGGKATRHHSILRRTENVSIHAFRGEGDADSGVHSTGGVVSIHAFRGEGDGGERRRLIHHTRVSIHAFRGEGDRNI